MIDEDASPKVEKPPSVKVSPSLIASALDSQGIRTSFGKLPLASETSAPVFSFSKSHRDAAKKVYLGEEFATSKGAGSPGPKYLIRDNISMKVLPKLSFGRDRRTLNGSLQRFDYFDRKDLLSDVVSAAANAYPKPAAARFGTSTRFVESHTTCSPGPIYDPKLTSGSKGGGKFVVGGRHPGVQGDPLMLFTGTTKLVGPGRYSPGREFGAEGKTTSFSKSVRRTLETHPTSKHQTYVSLATSLGPQVESKKQAASSAVFGKGTRDHIAKTAVFNSLMDTQQLHVRLPHPVL